MSRPREEHVGKSRAEKKAYYDNVVRGAPEPTFGEAGLPKDDATGVVRDARRPTRVRPERDEAQSWHLPVNPTTVIGGLLTLILAAGGLYLRDIHEKVGQFNRELGEIKEMVKAGRDSDEIARKQLAQEIDKNETRVDNVERRVDGFLADLLKERSVGPASPATSRTPPK